MPTTLTPREILEKVKERIMAEPLNYDQRDFCHTACCIAGHIDVILNGSEVHAKRTSSNGGISQIDGIATAAIGEIESPWLFGTIKPECEYNEEGDDGEPEQWDASSGDYWPPDLSDEYVDAGRGPSRSLVGCKAIDRYMKERGI